MSIPETLHAELRQLRDTGLDFDAAWALSVDAALVAACDASDWADALDATRPAWRAAYDLAAPTSAARACSMLADRDDGRSLEGRCAACAGPLPPSAHPTRRLYCSDGCRRLVSRQREREPIAA